jgi:hypothetical protein
MSNIGGKAARALAIALAVTNASCAAVVVRSNARSPFTGTQTFRTEAERLAVAAGRDESFRLVLGPAPSDACAAAPVVFRFAWVTDVQLRQTEVKLGSKRLSRWGDQLIPSFERDHTQETFGWAAYVAQVAAVNEYAAELATSGQVPLSFLIHTGDAIDAGSIEEMHRFLFATNLLSIPWLNVVGNHDSAIFGNYAAEKTYVRAPGTDFFMLGRSAFMKMHARRNGPPGASRSEIDEPADSPTVRRWVEADRSAKAREVWPQRQDAARALWESECHGFDLGHTWAPLRARECDQFPGWYHTLVAGADGSKVLLVVLDTTKRRGWGAEAELSEAQRDFLTVTLAKHHDVPALVFAHHQATRELQDAIFDSGHDRVFYFSGHTHDSRAEARTWADGGLAFAEFNGGSLIEFPQYGRVVELHRTANGTCAVSRAAWPSYYPYPGSHVVSTDPTDRRKLRACVNAPETRISRLEDAVECAYLGAKSDYVSQHTKPTVRVPPRERQVEAPAREEISVARQWAAANTSSDAILAPRGAR